MYDKISKSIQSDPYADPEKKIIIILIPKNKHAIPGNAKIKKKRNHYVQ